MSPHPHLRLQIHNRIATVTLDRGDGLNRLDTGIMEALRDVALSLAGDPNLAAVVLHGANVFSAGVDLAEFEAIPPTTLSELRERLKLGPALCRAWEELEAFTIAAIEGHCVGGAAALAASLDYRVLGASAFLRLPEVPLGINMSWGAIPRLVSQIGPARAKQYVMLGRRVPGAQALAWGLCEELAPDGETLPAALRLAEEVSRLPPLPARMTKHSINAAANALHTLAAHMDRDQYLLTAQSADFAEGVSAFREKREPRFRGD